MTGGAFIPSSGGAGAEEYELDDAGNLAGSGRAHAVQWVGKAGVKGPRWARMPLLTVGMLGIQCVWSIEMGYASPYLLSLGLSKSLMSLVFMAGPLSGLVVQPLVGIFADRSKSRYGRRRPYMLAGCSICVGAMVLLGWAREIGAFFGVRGNWMAIALAVWSIYCIDFSINAVMSTDRALVVDTLPPSQQEEGSAWAGRMFGFGSVAGFFVGNLDLPPYLPFLGKTQLQILSFLTSVILMLTHAFTSWAVTERVLLRDDRPQSKGGLVANLKSIWDNMFALPPGIRTVCFIQFFASLGWFPILFFTTVWVSEIYKSSVPMPEGYDDAAFEADAVRAGARALFFQSLVNIVTSIGLPFLVSHSGLRPVENEHGYEMINGAGEDGMPGSNASWKRGMMSGRAGSDFKSAVVRWFKGLKEGKIGITLPIQGMTLVRVWYISQFLFAGAMAASWFVSTVNGAYFILASTGFCWALFQWAPFSLLGELILIDGTIDRTQSAPLLTRTRPSIDDASPPSSPHRSPSPPPLPHPVTSSVVSSSRHTPLHSRHSSRTSFEDPFATSSTSAAIRPPALLEMERSDSNPGGLSPLIIQTPTVANPDDIGSTVMVEHSDDDDEHDHEDHRQSMNSPSSPIPRHRSPTSGAGGGGGGAKETADKAGVILGIHNVFLVLPQFIVTFLSSIIFYLMEPDKGLPAHHPLSVPVANATVTGLEQDGGAGAVGEVVERWLGTRAEGVVDGHAKNPDAVGLIFRIGGVSAAIGGVICYRLSRSWARGEGI